MLVKKIKILRIITRLNIGGPALHVSALCNGIDKLCGVPVENHLIYGALEEGEGDMSYLVAGKNVHLHILPRLKQQIRIFDDFVTLVRLCFIMLKIRPQIVHTHTAKAGILGRMAAFLTFRRIVVHTYHGHSFSGYFSPAFSRFFRIIDRCLGFFSSRIISISPGITTELTQKHHVVSRRKIVEISLGLSLKNYWESILSSAQARQMTGLAQNVRIWGCIGRMVEIKNHKMMLQAWQKMPESFREKNHLVFVGEGPLLAEIRDFIRIHALGKSVSLISWQKDLVAYYQSFDVLILPSLNEGTPVAVIEAMASGILSVASAVGGVPDLMGKILERRDHDVCLCERGVMISPTLESLGAVFDWIDDTHFFGTDQIKAAKEFSRQFGVERLISNVAGLYESLL